MAPECKAGLPETVAAFVLSSAPVHCTDAAAFCFEGRQVRLTHVKYGVLNDCPAGCSSRATNGRGLPLNVSELTWQRSVDPRAREG